MIYCAMKTKQPRFCLKSAVVMYYQQINSSFRWMPNAKPQNRCDVTPVSNQSPVLARMHSENYFSFAFSVDLYPVRLNTFSPKPRTKSELGKSQYRKQTRNNCQNASSLKRGLEHGAFWLWQCLWQCLQRVSGYQWAMSTCFGDFVVNMSNIGMSSTLPKIAEVRARLWHGSVNTIKSWILILSKGI